MTAWMDVNHQIRQTHFLSNNGRYLLKKKEICCEMDSKQNKT